MTVRQVALRPAAVLPVALAVAAMVVLAAALATGVQRPPDGDEGTAARLWQLLMAGQLVAIAFFGATWFPRAPRQAAIVIAIQLSALLAAAAPVLLLHL